MNFMIQKDTAKFSVYQRGAKNSGYQIHTYSWSICYRDNPNCRIQTIIQGKNDYLEKN